MLETLTRATRRHARRDGRRSRRPRAASRATAVVSPTRDLGDERLTEAVRASFGNTQAERLRVVIDSLVRHLHAFIVEVGLSEDEWLAGIEFLTETGHITGRAAAGVHPAVRRPRCVDARHRAQPSGFGHRDGIDRLRPVLRRGRAAVSRTVTTSPTVRPGSRAWSRAGCVHGRPSRSRAPASTSGRRTTRGGTTFSTTTRRRREGGATSSRTPKAVTRFGRSVRRRIRSRPTGRWDGSCTSTGRSPMRPAHIHFRLQAEGHRTLTTHVFVAGDPFLDSDAVFGVKESLIAPFTTLERREVQRCLRLRAGAHDGLSTRPERAG